MTEIKSNYDDLLESFMANSAKAYDGSPRKNNVNTQSEKDHTKNKYKAYNIETKQATGTTISSRKKKRKTSAATKISVFLLVFALLFCLLDNNLDTITITYYKVKNNVDLSFSETDTQNADWSIEANPGTLYNMKPEVWDMLSYDERFETLENIKNIEFYYLGVPYDVVILIRDLADYTLGEYSDVFKAISIDKEHFNNDPIEDIVNTLCHECRHAYQYACIEAYQNTDEKYKKLCIFNQSEQLLENSFNYVEYDEAKNNYDEYYTQVMEADSFNYAAQVTNEYYSKLIPEYAAEQ